MGVKGLWKLLSPAGRMVDIATLRGKMLAVDASIWLTQFLKAMRDEEGRMIQNGHIVGTLRRICKLLYHRIKVVFVFDGGVPLLKKRIMAKRHQRQAFDETRRQRAARGLLANQLLLQREAQKTQFIQNHDEDDDDDDEEGVRKKQKTTNQTGSKKKTKNTAMFILSHDDEELDDDEESEKEELKMETKTAPEGVTAASKKKKPDPLQEILDVEDSEDDDAQEYNDDDDSDDELPYSLHDMDLSTLQHLPKEKQYSMLVRLKEWGIRDPRRREELLPVAGDPNQYSTTQLRHFLKDARKKKEVLDMQKSLASKKTEQGSRIASDFTRQFTLILDKSLDPSANKSTSSVSGNLSIKDLNEAQVPPTKKTAASVAASLINPSNTTARSKDVTGDDDWKQSHGSSSSGQRLKRLGLLQRECVERLYEGLNGAVDRETCLDMLLANGFKVKEVQEAFMTKLLDAPETKAKVKADQEQEGIDRLFEGLSGTVDRSTCKALLMSCDWDVEKTLLTYVENLDAQEVDKQQETIDLVDDHEDEAAAIVVPLSKKKKRIDSSSVKHHHHVQTNSTQIPPQEEEEDGETRVQSQPNEQGEKGIVDADVETDGDGQLIFRFRPEDITKESLALFSDVFMSELKGDDQQEEEIEWEEPDEEKLGRNEEDIQWEGDDEVPREATTTGASRVETLSSGETERKLDKVVGEEQHQEAIDKRDTVKSQPLTTASLVKDVVELNDDSSSSNLDYNDDDDGEEEEPQQHQHQQRVEEEVQQSAIISSEKALERALGISSNLTSWASSAVKRALKTHSAGAVLSSSDGVSPKPTHPAQLHRSTSTTSTSTPRSPFTTTAANKGSSPRNTKATTPSKATPVSPSSSPVINRLQEENRSLRSEVKRATRDADQVTPEMRQDVMELLSLFGFPFIESPMEAEAQCSALELAGVVDGVITDDSDAFLFGAKRVYKNIFTDRKNVEAYDADEMEKQFGFTREQYIYLALMMGSDYAEGVKGIGMVNAMEVLTAFPGGKEGLIKFRKWVHSAFVEEEDEEEEEEQDSKGRKKTKKRKSKKAVNYGIEEGDSEYTIQFKKSHAKLRRKWLVHGDFPEERVIEAYMNPTVHDFSSTSSRRQQLDWAEPDVDGIYRFCKQRLNWTDDKFEKEVLDPIRVFTSKKNIQTSMDQFVVRFEDRTRFAAIRSKRMAKAVHGIRSQQQQVSSTLEDEEDESIVAVDEMGNVISVADRAYGKGTSVASKGNSDQVSEKTMEEVKTIKQKTNRVVDSSSSSEEDSPSSEEEEVLL